MRLIVRLSQAAMRNQELGASSRDKIENGAHPVKDMWSRQCWYVSWLDTTAARQVNDLYVKRATISLSGYIHMYSRTFAWS